MITLTNACKKMSARRLEISELTIGKTGTMYYVFNKSIKSFPCTIAYIWRTDSEYITHHNSDEYPNTGAIVMTDDSGDMFEIAYSRI